MDALIHPHALAGDIMVLTQSDLAGMMQFGDYVEAVAEVFRLHAEGKTVLPPPMQIMAEGGAFHVKAASLPSTDPA